MPLTLTLIPTLTLTLTLTLRQAAAEAPTGRWVAVLVSLALVGVRQVDAISICIARGWRNYARTKGQ